MRLVNNSLIAQIGINLLLLFFAVVLCSTERSGYTSWSVRFNYVLMFLSGQTAKTAVALRKRGEPQFAPIKTTGVNIP